MKKRIKNQQNLLEKTLEQLLNQSPLRFSQMMPSSLPEVAGVYLITKIKGSTEIPYYVGRTKNIRQRLYYGQLKGRRESGALKKYLVDNNICSTYKEAENFVLKNCTARWLEEDDYRVRGAMEGYFTAMLFPEYGIYEEH